MAIITGFTSSNSLLQGTAEIGRAILRLRGQWPEERLRGNAA